LFIAVGVHSLLPHTITDIKSFIAVTTLPAFSFSNRYFENRYYQYSDYRYSVHPDMKPINHMDYVYAKQ